MYDELTEVDIKKMQEELDYRRITLRPQLLEEVKVARGFGDLSENSEYDEAKNEQGKLYSRINELENVLLHAVIIEEGDMPTDRVTIGSTVTVTDVKRGKNRKFRIVGSQEADAMNGIISEDSPFGKALMGAREGQQVTVVAPAGEIQYTVDKIER